MSSYAFVLKVKPGYEEEYKRRHDEIWPEMSAFLNEAGFKNYHIYRYGLDLFAYFECDDFDELRRVSDGSEVNKRWGEYMGPIMDIDVDPATGFPFLLTEMFCHH